MSERWLLSVELDHRPGAVGALAVVFAARGVQVDALAAADVASSGGRAHVVIGATEARARSLARIVERLAVVRSCSLRPATAEDLASIVGVVEG